MMEERDSNAVYIVEETGQMERDLNVQCIVCLLYTSDAADD